MTISQQHTTAERAASKPPESGTAPGSEPADGGSLAAWGRTPPWEELVTAALLGSERRTPPGGSATALLDLAAIHTVRQRAGLRAAAAGQRLRPAPADSRPPLPPAAARRLVHLLTQSGRSGGSAPGAGGRNWASVRLDLGELLPEWLSHANSRGFRPPSALLPALLDAARARSDLRTEALRFAGPRAAWLARLNTEWKYALRAAAQPAEPAAHDRENVQHVWDEGLFAERVALLTAVRRRDPDAGRELLATTWATERAEDRLMFLDSLREGLSSADEPFLEAALTDRSKNVRSTAAELLSTLPGSALAGRMSQRARSCVATDSTTESGTPTLVVEPPYECDAEMRRDGVVPEPPNGRGKRSWWLVQTVEAAPLAAWSAHLGGRTPAEILALPVADGWRQDLHTSWAWAAVRQQDAEWAAALLGRPTGQAAETPGDPARLLAVLPADRRAEWAAGHIAAHGLSDAFRVLSSCAVPWSPALGQVVVDALEIAREAGSYPWSFSGVLGLAERCLDPAQADRLAPLAARSGEAADSAPGAGAYWSDAFERLVHTLRIRERMLQELRGEPAEPAPPTP